MSAKVVGPIYGVELLEELPLNGGMLQQMASRRDLEQVERRVGTRVVAAYEVLTQHYRRAKKELDERLAAAAGLTDAEKALNLWLLWECSDRYVSGFTGLCAPRVLPDGRTIASDTYRMVCIDAGATLPVLVDLVDAGEMRWPSNVEAFIDGRHFIGQWQRLELQTRKIDRDYDSGRWVFFREDRIDGLRVNAELLWPFSLIPNVEYCRDGSGILVRWKGGRGIVLGMKGHDE